MAGPVGSSTVSVGDASQGSGWFGPEWRQQGVEQRDHGVRVKGGALPQGFLPPGLKVCGQLVTHTLRGVGIEAAHSRAELSHVP
jgi:hypothetical protein